MNVVCTVNCDNCGKGIINDPDTVTIFTIDDDMLIISKCPKCKDPLTGNLTKERARTIAHRGVKVFSWHLAEEISPESI